MDRTYLSRRPPGGSSCLRMRRVSLAVRRVSVISSTQPRRRSFCTSFRTKRMNIRAVRPFLPDGPARSGVRLQRVTVSGLSRRMCLPESNVNDAALLGKNCPETWAAPAAAAVGDRLQDAGRRMSPAWGPDAGACGEAAQRGRDRRTVNAPAEKRPPESREGAGGWNAAGSPAHGQPDSGAVTGL